MVRMTPTLFFISLMKASFFAGKNEVEELVVTMPPRRVGQKDDARDALGLAEGLRTGAIRQRVYKACGPYSELRHQRAGGEPPISGTQLAGARHEADDRFGGEHPLSSWPRRRATQAPTVGYSPPKYQL